MKQPKFKVGQVVGVRGSVFFYRVDRAEQRVSGDGTRMPTATTYYYFRGLIHPEPEGKLRKQTKKEIANG